MAAGDLSPDQARYAAKVAADTGLAPTVVRAWVGTESGWGTTKAGHNYLNVGPGETFASVELAANRASALVRASDRYAGIRAAIPAGPLAQVRAIGESPWGTNAALLTRVHAQLAGPSSSDAATPVVLTGGLGIPLPKCSSLPGWVAALIPCERDEEKTLPEMLLPVSPDTAKRATEDVAGALGVDLSDLMKQALGVGLGLVFTVAAFALIALGLNRLTGVAPRERFNQVSGLVGGVGAAAKLAGAIA